MREIRNLALHPGADDLIPLLQDLQRAHGLDFTLKSIVASPSAPAP
jgi:hypothetical protein